VRWSSSAARNKNCNDKTETKKQVCGEIKNEGSQVGVGLVNVKQRDEAHRAIY